MLFRILLKCRKTLALLHQFSQSPDIYGVCQEIFLFNLANRSDE